MARLLTLLVFVGLTHALGMVSGQIGAPGSDTLSMGFLLLASFLAGRAARTVELPQITGYLLIGLLVGPHGLRTLSSTVVERFELVNEVALALIALSAGGELHIESLKARLRSIATITGLQILLVLGAVAGLVYLARSWIPFLTSEPSSTAIAVALLFGLASVAKSPATTIAVITEERARGISTETVLGITVLKDVLILLLIAVVLPLSVALEDPSKGFDLTAAGEILASLLASIASGLGLGWLVSAYLRRIPSYRVLFILGVAFLSVYLRQRFGLEYVITAMAAGFYVQNFSRQGRRMLRALETNSLPLYALFFALAGAGLDISVLGRVWPIALALIAARAVALWGSTYLGARLAGDPPAVRRYAWLGFLAQAGVTLGIANRVEMDFPVWGGEVATVIVATIVVNQLVGPPAFRWALLKAGESHRRLQTPIGVRRPAFGR